MKWVITLFTGNMLRLLFCRDRKWTVMPIRRIVMHTKFEFRMTQLYSGADGLTMYNLHLDMLQRPDSLSSVSCM